MNHIEAPSDNAEVERLMRESDSLGADSSLFLRAFRQLTASGKPIGRLFMPLIPSDVGQKKPIGMLTYNKRLVFWPVLPRRKCGIVNHPKLAVPDHVTVEFPSEKVHVTSYGPDGKKIRQRDAWRSASIDGSEVRLLFAYYIRLDIIREQDVLVARKFATPRSVEERRKAEFVRCANNLIPYDLSGPLSSIGADFAYFGIFRTNGELTAETLPRSLMPKPAMDGLVDNWPENEQIPLSVGQMRFGELHLCLVAGLPPGKLREDICFGFPQRDPRRARNQS